MTDWDAIKAEYVAGRTTYRALCAKHGVTMGALSKRAKAGRWTDLRKQASEKSDKKIVDRAAAAMARRAERLKTVADRVLDKIEVYATDPALCTTTREIRELTGSMRDLKDVLGVKGEADLREQEARINKLIADSKRDEQPDQTIRVVLSPEAMDLSE